MKPTLSENLACRQLSPDLDHKCLRIAGHKHEHVCACGAEWKNEDKPNGTS